MRTTTLRGAIGCRGIARIPSECLWISTLLLWAVAVEQARVTIAAAVMVNTFLYIAVSFLSGQGLLVTESDGRAVPVCNCLFLSEREMLLRHAAESLSSWT